MKDSPAVKQSRVSQTEDQIYDAARRCFFQYGFSKASLTMIAQEAGVSRVTLYKYFPTKDYLFGQVVSLFLTAKVEESRRMVEREPDFWQSLEQVIDQWTISPFEAIANDLVLNDLKYAARRIVGANYKQWKHELTNILEDIIDQAAREGTIDPGCSGLSCAEVAETVTIMVTGLTNNSIADLRGGITTTIRFLKAVLRPT